MPAETTFTLQTWTVWYGGREVDFGQEKQYAIAAQFPADVLALQECWGSAAENLARSSWRIMRSADGIQPCSAPGS